MERYERENQLVGQITDLQRQLRDAQATVEALQAQLVTLKRHAGLDCGDQSCLYALAHSGMRTNGGCRCSPKRMKDDLERSRKAVEALQRELESANALLHKKNCAIGRAETTIEALQRERDFFETAAATANRMRVDTERALDAEREKVKGLHEITKVICAHCCEPMEIPSKAALQTQLGRTLPATTPAGQRWRREKPTEPGWYWWRHNACSPVHATYLERGNGCDHDGLWYAKENMCVPHNAAYVPYGEWQGPISPNEATE